MPVNFDYFCDFKDIFDDGPAYPERVEKLVIEDISVKSPPPQTFPAIHCKLRIMKSAIEKLPPGLDEASSKRTATADSDVVQSGRPIFDDFFQHLWPYIGNNTANVVFQMVKRLWLIRTDQ
ncbi:hypothetical protein TNCV_792171 [Trichonephila clavipes]|nr:hypothetical protein TNCV_792171 [Trichonephila clavipes]